MALNISSNEHLELDETLHRLGGDEEILRELFAVFGADAPAKLEGVRAAMAAGDMALVVRYAHTLKGACAVVGAARCKGLAMELERRAASGEIEAAEDLFQRIREEVKITLEQMNAA